MRYVLRRLGFFVATLWACLTINFVLPRLMPGNPAIAMMARFKGRINGQALKALEVAFGVNNNQSAIRQYFGYLGNTLTGHFGTSLTFFPDPVSRVVFSALPWTIGLVGVTTVLAFIAGTLVGMAAAWRRGGVLDSVLPPLFVIISAFPYFFLALMGLLLFSVTLHWLPLGFGYANTDTPALTWHFIGDVLSHALLPGMVILITSIGGWVLTMRNNMISTLSEDYVRMARAKGLRPWRIMIDYCARNAILPNLAGFAIQIGFVLGGAILVEYTFSYPGVGGDFVSATDAHDFPVLAALFLLFTLAVLICVLIADLLTAILDPRTRES
jgi:peptide/nickel transport system permease protein